MTTAASDLSVVVTAREKQQAARRTRARNRNRISVGILWGMGGFLVIVFAYILIYSLQQGLPAITTLDFFTSANPDVGIAPQIFNTFYMLILSMVFMIPIGFGAAIYMVEYAKQGRFNSILRFATETLTSTPTIIFGLFGFLILSAKFTGQYHAFQLGPIVFDGFGFGYSRLSGAITLALVNLPWMLRTMEDALRSVPRDLREASLALGATRYRTVTRTVLPAAIPGIVTGILIVSGRVIGESAALLFTASQSASYNNWYSLDPLKPGPTLALHAYVLFTTGVTANAQRLRLGTALTLIILVLIFNLVARCAGTFINNRFTGAK